MSIKRKSGTRGLRKVREKLKTQNSKPNRSTASTVEKASTRNIVGIILPHLNIGNQTVFIIMMIAAVYITVVRLLGPIQIHWDFSVQIDAAYRFTQGLGLTNAFSSQPNLNQPPIAEPLTHFPPGLSLLIASFLYFNIPLAIALKIIYGLITMIGWTGWSVMASHCLTFPADTRSRSTALYIVIAAILPVFYTPHWTDQGTDIILWAGIPLYVLLLLSAQSKFSGVADSGYESAQAPDSVCPLNPPTLGDFKHSTPPRIGGQGGRNHTAIQQHQFSRVRTSLAGALFITLMTFRYASGFLLPAALLILFYAHYPRLKRIGKHYVAFFVPLVAIAGPAVGYVQKTSAVQLDSLVSRFLDTHALDISKS